MRPDTGLILRLLGPLIEVACLLALFSPWGRGRSFAGIPVEHLLYAAFAAGMVMVVVGLALSRPAGRRPRSGRWGD